MYSLTVQSEIYADHIPCVEPPMTSRYIAGLAVKSLRYETSSQSRDLTLASRTKTDTTAITDRGTPQTSPYGFNYLNHETDIKCIVYKQFSHSTVDYYY